VEILAFLTTDEDAEIRSLALATLDQCPVEELHPILTNPATPASFLELVATHLAPSREELLEILLINPALSKALADMILSRLTGSRAAPAAAVASSALAAEPVPSAVAASMPENVPDSAPALATTAPAQHVTVSEMMKGQGAGGMPKVAGGESPGDLLALLSAANDEQSLDLAWARLQKGSDAELKQILASPTTPVSILELAATRLVKGREDLLEFLLVNPAFPERLQDQILSELANLGGPSEELIEEAVPATEMEEELAPATSAAIPVESAQVAEPDQPGAKPKKEEKEKKRETLVEKIGRMSAVEKIKLALTGNQEARFLLIRDANKIVSRSVLQSPKLSDAEMEAYASLKNVSEEVLRLIAMNRAFIKNYSVARALINNPRAPIDVSLPLLSRINEKDLKGLSLNRNVPEVIRGMAAKMIKAREEASKPRLPGKKH
jgi:hypothetical protein